MIRKELIVQGKVQGVGFRPYVYKLATKLNLEGFVLNNNIGVIIQIQGNKSLRMHSENCLHCKTCDIKSPNGGITWTTPYGEDGPEYREM